MENSQKQGNCSQVQRSISSFHFPLEFPGCPAVLKVKGQGSCIKKCHQKRMGDTSLPAPLSQEQHSAKD